jgi:hypothetical protein
VRDWWAMDWVWSALHLDDGTHLHGVDIRIPGTPPIGIGYLQQPGEPLIELQSVTARETFGDNALPQTTTLRYGDVTATIDVRGHAPVLLTAPDGRVSHFPRAWATIISGDAVNDRERPCLYPTRRELAYKSGRSRQSALPVATRQVRGQLPKPARRDGIAGLLP